MLTCNYSKEILNNQSIKVKKIDETEKELKIHTEIRRKKCVCPVCGKETDKIHDYRMQIIKQLPAFGKAVRLILRKRRYVCDCGKRFSEWILNADSCGLIPFEKCASTYRNWHNSIINSLKYKYSNGFTEGCNNKIKVLKRNAFGFSNFKRFRNRILFVFS